MSILIQNILVFFAFLLAVGFLIKKFFWKSTVKKKSKSCGSGGTDCGCH
ncbi:FeoB-associated Cys-rich membrane protein [Aquimarina sp. 2201CG1-2-11]